MISVGAGIEARLRIVSLKLLLRKKREENLLYISRKSGDVGIDSRYLRVDERILYSNMLALSASRSRGRAYPPFIRGKGNFFLFTTIPYSIIQ